MSDRPAQTRTRQDYFIPRRRDQARSKGGMTLDTYSYVLAGMQRKAVNAITEVLSE
jgi:hypothetical protein